jgi:dynactin 1
MGLPDSATMDYDYNIGARVLVHGENSGTVRYVGATSFQTGRWIGVELDEPKGKNAGVVQGKRYFDCRTQHGVFVRPTQVKLLPPSPLNSNSSRRRSIYNNDCSDYSSSSDDLIGDCSSMASLNQQEQLYKASQQQLRTNPTATPSKRLSSQPSSTKSSAPSSTAKKRPTSLTDNATPRASITLSAAQNRRQSISSKQQQPPVTSRTSTVRPLPQQNGNPSLTMEPSSVKTTPSSQLQALKMKQLQQLQFGQPQQQQPISSSSSQQSSDMDYTDDDDIEDEYEYEDEDGEVSEQDAIGDDDEVDDDDDIMDNYTDDDQIETASFTESDHSEELDIDSGIDEQQQDYQQTTTSMVNTQQVYGALSSTKPISKSDQVNLYDPMALYPDCLTFTMIDSS